MLILIALILILLPALILWLTHRYQWAGKVGVIVLCYLAGLVVGNSGLLPAETLPVREGISETAVALALPMLLFTLDIRNWSRVAGKAMLSMILATMSVVAMATSLFFVFRGEGADTASHLAGMAVGVYTGGTPNLAAIKAGLDIPHSEYIMFHSLDTVIGASYLLGMLTLGIPFFRRILRQPSPVRETPQEHQMQHFDEEDYRPLLKLGNLPQLLQVTGLSCVVLLLSLGLSRWLESVLSLQDSSALVIVALTSFGILLSLIHRVRGMHLAYKAGMYLIYVFCFAVASMAQLEDLLQLDATVAIYLLGTIFGSLLLHTLLCKLAGVDSDTFMITSVAAVASPPFVPMLARALDNPGTILSGMTTGIIGYALGNYLGISLALYLQSL